MNKQKNLGISVVIFHLVVVLLAVATINPQSASSTTSVATYAIEEYQEFGPETYPYWQRNLPGVCTNVYHFRDIIDADVEGAYCGDVVSRSTIQDRYGTGFDRYDMVYWHAHTHTLPYNEDPSGYDDWWWDPDNLYNWGTSENAYLWFWADFYNPSWFEYPCNNNEGPGYTYGDYYSGKTVGMPMWQGYYGRCCGVSVLTLCDLNRLESGGGPGHGLGKNQNEWMIMDSCDAVRVAEPEGEYAVNDGVYAWDQTFDRMHGVYGHYRSIYADPDKAGDFATFLVVDDKTIWEAYKAASLDNYHTDNKRVSVITAENKERIRLCFMGHCWWYYPYWDLMTINDHWHGHGYVAYDIDHLDIEYYYTQWYDPD